MNEDLSAQQPEAGTGAGPDQPVAEASAGALGYTGTEYDPALDVDFDLEDFDEDNGDMLRLAGIGFGVAAAVGGLAWFLAHRRHRATGVAAVAERVTTTAAAGGKELQQLAADLSQVDVQDLIKELRKRARDLHLEREMAGTLDLARKRAQTLAREGRQAVEDVDLPGAGDRARHVAEDVRQHVADLDAGELHKVFAEYSERVVGAIESLREDLAPAVRHRAADAADVIDEGLPKAREAARAAAGRLHDVAERGRAQGAHLIEEQAPRARKAASEAGGMAGKLRDLLKVVALQVVEHLLTEVLPAARKRRAEMADRAKEDGLPFVRERAADAVERAQHQTMPFLRHRAADVIERLRDDALPFVRHRAADAAGLAREEVAPRVRQATEAVTDRLSDAADAVRPAVNGLVADGAVAGATAHVGDAVQETVARVADAVDTVKEGVTAGVVSVGHRAGTVARQTGTTTRYLTRETTGIFLWLALLGGLILLVFVPDREKQAELWRTLQRLMTELRQMWTDFQGSEFAGPDEADAFSEFTGDQA